MNSDTPPEKVMALILVRSASDGVRNRCERAELPPTLTSPTN